MGKIGFDSEKYLAMQSEKILERKNFLLRPMIANVDIAVVITSTKEPDLDLNLLDKLLTVIHKNKIKPLICFTKTDLLNEEEKNISNISNNDYNVYS